MGDERRFNFGIRRAPLNKWMSLVTLADSIHERYTLSSQGTNTLLFDSMYVDAIFHDENDPLKDCYPNKDQVKSQIVQSSTPIETLAENLQHCGGINDVMIDLLNQYLEMVKVLPSVISRQRTPDVSKEYKDKYFIDQIPNTSETLRVLEKQGKFILALNDLHNSQDLQNSLESYTILSRSVDKNLTDLKKASDLYDQIIKLVYDNNPPFKKFGNAPEVQNDITLTGIIESVTIMQRPAVQHYIDREIRKNLEAIKEICSQAKLTKSREGLYSTRPDLR